MTKNKSESEVLQSLVQEMFDLKKQLEEMRQQVNHGHRTMVQEMKRKLSKEDYDCLPHRIIILRHGESQGNVDKNTYCFMPDHAVPLTERGHQQAAAIGHQLREMLEKKHGSKELKVFFMTSPYLRTLETTDQLMDAFDDEQVTGQRQAVQLREQDFGNFQDPDRINRDLCDRNKFGRFWFRFPNGESGADVYDRLTIFEDHLTRDMFMGRFANTNLVMVTHGLTLRIFLMRWFHWSVDDFLRIYNPGNCEPVVVEKLPWEVVQDIQRTRYTHAKHVYHIPACSMVKLKGLTPELCSYLPQYTGKCKIKWQIERCRDRDGRVRLMSPDAEPTAPATPASSTEAVAAVTAARKSKGCGFEALHEGEGECEHEEQRGSRERPKVY